MSASHALRSRPAPVLAVLSLLFVVAAAGADDRDLLRQSSGQPYVFVVFDTSGSMNWAPKCDAAQFAAGTCDFLCPSGDCFTPLNGDDPASKMYQAKEALHEVVGSLSGIHFGFATYNQNQLRVDDKHWLYRVAPTRFDGTPQVLPRTKNNRIFPTIGSTDVFGATWGCDEGNGDAEVGCYDNSTDAAGLDDAWELARVQRFPKLGRSRTASTTFYVHNPSENRRYEVTYAPVANLSAGPPAVPNAYGNAWLSVDVTVRCTNNCNGAYTDTKRVYYQLVGEFLQWDNGVDRGPDQMGFFDDQDHSASSTCDGWDPTTDTSSDLSSGYNLRWPTDATDPRNDPDGNGTNNFSLFNVGDVLPLDWNTNNVSDLRSRLASGTNPDGTPNFALSSYFNNNRQGGDTFLRLKDSVERVLIPQGSTPLGNSIRDFRTWYAGCDHGSCPNNTGWGDWAAQLDPDFACREKFLLVITDGDNTCSGPSACSSTAALRAQEDIRTYVVAFGVANTSGNQLNCMAANGGTGQPIYPQNKQELIDALTNIFSEIQVAARAFSSASVPTVQNETSDKIYFSTFTPFPDVAVWPGIVDSFRKPVPIDPSTGAPDIDLACGTGVQSACHLWNVAAVLRDQAPTPAAAAAGTFRLGPGPLERRILYGMEWPSPAVPRDLRLMVDTGSAFERYDLWRGLGIVPAGTAAGSLTPAAEATASTATRRVLGNLVKIKGYPTVPDFDPNVDLRLDMRPGYVLGDVFHADPLLTESPSDLRYFRSDASYRDFAEEHEFRRRMLVVGANDGQLHFFDGGVARQVTDPTTGQDLVRFTDGTGRELFSYVPRLVLPIIKDQFDGSPVADPLVTGKHIFSLDGFARVADVFIDPEHGGTPAEDEREWRTLLVGGLREAGDIIQGGTVSGFISGYYALDLTEPDATAIKSSGAAATVPDCLLIFAAGGGQQPPPGGCGPVPFPAELWTFTDSILDPATLRDLRLDEDNPTLDPAGGGGNDQADLADTWSKPVVGKIRLCKTGGAACGIDPLTGAYGSDVEGRFVAIFGGGVLSESPSSVSAGNWIYMVDVETGKTIYKRQVQGAVPAGPAAIDRDQDGFLEAIYVGTTAGLMYKVDLENRTLTGEVPGLQPLAIQNDRLVGSPLPVAGAILTERVLDRAWDPVAFFNTLNRPIYMTATLQVVPDLERVAIAFGTGFRANLWENDAREGRFFNVVDMDFGPGSPAVPLTELDFPLIDQTDPVTTLNLLVTDRGWGLRLEPGDRLITQPTALVGVMIFTIFKPQATLAGPAVCGRTGVSRVFVIDASNANPFAALDPTDPGVLVRYMDIGDFTTPPFVDQTATKNPPPDGSGSPAPPTIDDILDQQQEELQEAIRQALMAYFPSSCRYNRALSLTVSANTAGTSVVRFATIPIAMCPRDWREN